MRATQRRTARRGDGETQSLRSGRRKRPLMTGASAIVFIALGWSLLRRQLGQDTGLAREEVAVVFCLVLAALLLVLLAVGRVGKWARRKRGVTHSAADVLYDDSYPVDRRT